MRKLVAVNKLRGRIFEMNYSQKDVAKAIGISPKTFYEKMKKGVFGTDEVMVMVTMLKIDNPTDYFFVQR